MSSPDIHTTSQNLKNWILQLPEVVEAPHRFGGTQFQVNGLEFMHFHGDTFLDIRLSKEAASKSRMPKILREPRTSFKWPMQTREAGLFERTGFLSFLDF